MTEFTHDLPINDIRHAWVESRRMWNEVSPGVYELGVPIDVYVGRCTCGWQTEGRYSGDVTKSWMAHRDTIGEEVW